MPNNNHNDKTPKPKSAWTEKGSALPTNIVEVEDATHLDTPQKKIRISLEQYAIQANSARTQKQITKMPVINSPIPAELPEHTNTIIADTYILSTYNVRYLIAILNNRTLREAILQSPYKHSDSKGEHGGNLKPTLLEQFRNYAYNLFCTAYGLKPPRLTAALIAIRDSRKKPAEAQNQLHTLMRESLNNSEITNEKKRSIFLNLYHNYDRKHAFMLSTEQPKERDRDAIITVLSFFCPKHLLTEAKEEEKLKVKKLAAITNRLLQTELRDPNFCKALDFDILTKAICRINDSISATSYEVKSSDGPKADAATRALINAFQDKENGVTLAKLCLNSTDIRKKLKATQLRAFAKYNVNLAYDIINNSSWNVHIKSAHVVEMIETHITSQALAERAFKKSWLRKSYQFTDAQLISMAIKNSFARDEILKNRELCFRILKASTSGEINQLQHNGGGFLHAATAKISTTRLWQTNYMQLLQRHRISTILKNETPPNYLKDKENLDWACQHFSEIADELKNASHNENTKLIIKEFMAAILSAATLEQEDQDTLVLLKGHRKILLDGFSRLELSVQEDILIKPREKISKTLREKIKALQEKVNALQEKAKTLREKVKALQKKVKAFLVNAKSFREKSKAFRERAKALQEKAKALQEKVKALKKEYSKNETTTDLQGHLERHVALGQAMAQLEAHNLKMKLTTSIKPANESKRSELKLNGFEETAKELKEQVESIVTRIKLQERKLQQELKRVVTLHESPNNTPTASPLYDLFVDLFNENQLEKKLTIQQQLYCAIHEPHIKNFIFSHDKFYTFFTTFSKITDEELSDITKDEAGQKFVIDLLKQAGSKKQKFIADHLTACLPCANYLMFNKNASPSNGDENAHAEIIRKIHKARNNKKQALEERFSQPDVDTTITLYNRDTGTLNNAAFCIAYLCQPLATLKKQNDIHLYTALQTICIKNQAFNFKIKNNQKNLEYIMGRIFNTSSSELSKIIDKLPGSFSGYIIGLPSIFLAGKYDQTKADIFYQALYKFTSDNQIKDITDNKHSPGRHALLTSLSQHSIKLSSDWKWAEAEQLINMTVKYKELFHELRYLEFESERVNGGLDNDDATQIKNMAEWCNANNITDKHIQIKLKAFRFLLQHNQTLGSALEKLHADKPDNLPLACCIVNDPIIRLALLECLNCIEALTIKENPSHHLNKMKLFTLESRWSDSDSDKEIKIEKPFRKTIIREPRAKVPAPKLDASLLMPITTPSVALSNSRQDFKKYYALSKRERNKLDQRKKKLLAELPAQNNHYPNLQDQKYERTPKQRNSLYLSKILASLNQATAKAKTEEAEANAAHAKAPILKPDASILIPTTNQSVALNNSEQESKQRTSEATPENIDKAYNNSSYLRQIHASLWRAAAKTNAEIHIEANAPHTEVTRPAPEATQNANTTQQETTQEHTISSALPSSSF